MFTNPPDQTPKLFSPVSRMPQSSYTRHWCLASITTVLATFGYVFYTIHDAGQNGRSTIPVVNREEASTHEEDESINSILIAQNHEGLVVTSSPKMYVSEKDPIQNEFTTRIVADQDQETLVTPSLAMHHSEESSTHDNGQQDESSDSIMVFQDQDVLVNNFVSIPVSEEGSTQDDHTSALHAPKTTSGGLIEISSNSSSGSNDLEPPLTEFTSAVKAFRSANNSRNKLYMAFYE